MIAVAATLVGCSCEPPPHQAITQSRTYERQSAGLNRTAARPTAHLATTKAKPALITAKTEPSANRTLLPPPTLSAGSIGQPTVGLAPNSNSRTIQEQVAAATTVAKRGTVAALAAAGVLVAIVMARPEIRSVSDLEGKDVAMDEEYSESRNDILVAFASKGAHPSQISAGHSTAIDRLLKGEVPAAVLALVSTDSAEGFPDIAGFKVFQVPILPRSPAGNRDTPKRSE
jgi:ABC-type phosphate/phosphonate transport system substrate-binding protein